MRTESHEWYTVCGYFQRLIVGRSSWADSLDKGSFESCRIII